MATDIEALHRRGFEEGINQKRLDVFDELLAEEYVNYAFPAPAPGPEGFKQVMGMFFAAFPDMHVAIEEQVAEGDKVASRGTFTGTHTGDFMGIPPTGRTVAMAFIGWYRFDAEGKIAELRVEQDNLGLLQ